MVETRLLYTYTVFVLFMALLINSGISVFASGFDIDLPTPIQASGDGLLDFAINTFSNALSYINFYFQLMTINTTFAYLNYIIFLPFIAIFGYILIKDIIIPLLQAIANAIPL